MHKITLFKVEPYLDPTLKKVSIVGCPGAGKSTFARALSAKTNLPLIHLDLYYHQKEFDYEHNKKAWLDKLEELTSGDSWIIEGNYGSSYEQRIPKSDTLIFMDMPSWLSIWSVIIRRYQFRNKRRAEMPDDWVEKISPDFLKCGILFRFKSRKNVLSGKKKYKQNNLKIITFKNRKSAYKWIDTSKIN